MTSSSSELYLLLETAAGYILTHVKEWEVIGQDIQTVQQSLMDPTRFGQVVEVTAVYAFTNASEALENCQAVASSESTELLRTFLDQNLPKKRKKCQLGVLDPALGKHLSGFGFPVKFDKNTLELTRLCRLHIKRLVKEFGAVNLLRFQVGLGHSFSRAKIKMDPNRQDKPVQNAVALIENLDKMINTFAMRVKEWYSWHFPELAKIVPDNIKFAQVARLMRVKEEFDPSRTPELLALLGDDEEMVKSIMNARGISMGQDIVEADMFNIDRFAEQVIKLSEQRRHLGSYLGHKLENIAPNLQTLVGDVLAAKLISHAGSLTSLAKYPASTIQILGAEKALFRALKTKGNTPKYGLLFQSSFIGKAAQKNKGRISRYLANKCSLAARIDNFSSIPANIYGDKMKCQVEDRMRFLVEGVATKKNIDVMKSAMEEYDEKVVSVLKEQKKAAKKLKKSKGKGEVEEGDVGTYKNGTGVNGVNEEEEETESSKKRKHQDVESVDGEPKKKKKKEKGVALLVEESVSIEKKKTVKATKGVSAAVETAASTTTTTTTKATVVNNNDDEDKDGDDVEVGTHVVQTVNEVVEEKKKKKSKKEKKG